MSEQMILMVPIRRNMRYGMAIRNVPTGEVRTYEVARDCPWAEHSYFIWTASNFGCDFKQTVLFEEVADSFPDRDGPAA